MSKFLRKSIAGLPVIFGAGMGVQPALAQVEYVRICDAYGTGFFYIPGTDTCLRVGGYVAGGFGRDFGVGTGGGHVSFASNSGWSVQGNFETYWRDSNDAFGVDVAVVYQNPNSFHVAGFVRYADFEPSNDHMTEVGVDAAIYLGRVTFQGTAGVQYFNPGISQARNFDITKFAVHMTYYVNDNWKVGATVGRVSGYVSGAIGTEVRLGNFSQQGFNVRGFANARWVERSDDRPHNTTVMAGLRVNFGGGNASMMVEDRAGPVSLLQSAGHYVGLAPIGYKK